MTLIIRALQLRAETNGPDCGADVRFERGLNVLRADNSSGKSTCMQSIIYALGLEGMLSARREVPLPHVMTDTIDVDGASLRVRKSWVSLEVENHKGEILTITRPVAGGADNTLITTWRGAALTTGQATGRRDFFVRRKGAAQREAGFHFQLAAFLGWTLPQVSRQDGSEGPLYLECLFPYFFVEQKHGWSGVQARIPTYLGIRDVSRRSAEFILALDAYALILRRQRLESAGTIIQSDWRQIAATTRALAQSAAVVVPDVPDRPVALDNLPPIEPLVSRGTDWVSLAEEISRLRSVAAGIRIEGVPTVGEHSGQLAAELDSLQAELVENNQSILHTAAALEEARARHNALELRVSALEEDLQKHRDTRLLQRLGATHTPLLHDESRCPTCDQVLRDGYDITAVPMSIDESVQFIEQQLDAFRGMRADAERLVSATQAKLGRMQERGAGVRAQIRSLKDSLASPSTTPSIAAVAQKIRLEDQIEALERVSVGLVGMLERFAELSRRWVANRSELAALSEQNLSGDDVAKLDFLRRSLVDQLRLYGFESLTPESIEISPETYRPVHEGFDLGFDLSASDMIRVIWAYLLAFLETGAKYRTNHPGLLILDEPRQQETNQLSFSALLRRAAQDGEQGAQIIFATSADPGSLEESLVGLPHHLIPFAPGRRVVRPLP
ncbi:uncharacterized protein with PIN domain [Micromonospora sp. A200]|uniref:hypothetical protein n=1 Tax=Micromonospora sp. A200 TaxID=2940568 RepID=UPI002473360B|nr:hypothetical protein [Micromonospora sp. A200]MDH6464925.1 uncharacterized protein with PIN domain [Micromonospora sp. A200]